MRMYSTFQYVFSMYCLAPVRHSELIWCLFVGVSFCANSRKTWQILSSVITKYLAEAIQPLWSCLHSIYIYIYILYIL
jgi:hypothetical protein